MLENLIVKCSSPDTERACLFNLTDQADYCHGSTVSALVGKETVEIPLGAYCDYDWNRIYVSFHFTNFPDHC
jgi:hypothetical protein